MSLNLKKSTSNGNEKTITSEEQHAKINEVRRSIGSLSEKLAIYCSDASIARYLRARNWNVKKATKMLKGTLRWRVEYKPEEIRWDEVANEAETGKIYRTNYTDKHGRAVLVMRPSRQNSKSIKGQMRYLVYCMENAVLNLPPGQEQIVWLIDFDGFNLSHISVKVTQETAHVLQDYYPERLGLAILYNPPKFFEPFWTVVKPFLEPKTRSKVKFVYSDDPNSRKIMEDVFDMDTLESAFGGKNELSFSIDKYAERMREDDKRMLVFWTVKNSESIVPPTTAPPSEILRIISSNSDSDTSEIEKVDHSVSPGAESKALSTDSITSVAEDAENGTKSGHWLN